MRKHKIHKTVFWMMLAGVLLLAGPVAHPADAQEPKKTLSLEECLERGLKSSKALHATEMNVAASAAKAKEINASRLPSLKFNGGYTRLSEVPPFEVHLPFPATLPFSIPDKFVVSPSYVNAYSLRLALQQPLFTGGRLRANAEAAGLDARAAEQDYANDRNETIFQVKNAFWDLFEVGEIKRLIDENVERVKAHLGDVRNFFDQGLLTKNEVLKVEVQLSGVRLAQLDAANGVEMAAVWLNNLIGAALDSPIEPAVEMEDLETALKQEDGAEENLDDVLEKVLIGRPDLKAMDFRAKAGAAGVKAARSARYPQISLTGNYYDLRPNPRFMPARDRFDSTWDLSINVSFDLWNWRATARQTEQAKARAAQAMDRLGQMRDAAAVEIRQSRLAVKRAKEKIGLAETAVLQAEENLRITRDQFKEGVALNTEVLDAEMAWLQAKTNYVQTLVELERAKAKLIKALGE